NDTFRIRLPPHIQQTHDEQTHSCAHTHTHTHTNTHTHTHTHTCAHTHTHRIYRHGADTLTASSIFYNSYTDKHYSQWASLSLSHTHTNTQTHKQNICSVKTRVYTFLSLSNSLFF